MIEALTQTVDLPLWLVLTLEGHHWLFAIVENI